MKCKKCGQELEIGVKFCPNCGEDCVSQDTGIPIKSLLIKQKVQLMILGKICRKKKLKFQGKNSTCSRYLRLGRVSWQ